METLKKKYKKFERKGWKFNNNTSQHYKIYNIWYIQDFQDLSSKTVSQDILSSSVFLLKSLHK